MVAGNSGTGISVSAAPDVIIVLTGNCSVWLSTVSSPPGFIGIELNGSLGLTVIASWVVGSCLFSCFSVFLRFKINTARARMMMRMMIMNRIFQRSNVDEVLALVGIEEK